MDGWYPRVRIGEKYTRVAVLRTLGVCADSRRIVLDIRIAGQEREAACAELYARATNSIEGSVRENH
jgi:transposase-like protein